MTEATFRAGAELVAPQAALPSGIEFVERCCPICRHPNLRTPPSRYSVGQWTVKQCVRCSLVYLSRMPNQEAVAGNFDWARSSVTEEQWRHSSRPMVQTLRARLRWRSKLLRRKTMAARVAAMVGSGSVVDVGCGDGAELANLPPHIEAVGIEISAASAERARHRLSGRPARIVTASALEGLQSIHSDACTGAILRSYLQHEAEPRLVLEQLSRVLVRGGVAVVKVPNFASLNRMVMRRHWCGFRYPDHLNYFTPKTLRLVSEFTGFDVDLAFLDVLPTDDNMLAILRNNKSPKPITDLLPPSKSTSADPIIFRVRLEQDRRSASASTDPGVIR